MSNPSYSASERFDYLQKLIHEFNVSNSRDAKREVLANISCFAYNPINWEALNRLNIIPLLLDSLNKNDQKLKEVAISGLCNLCTDPKNKHKIFDNSVLETIHKFLIKNILNENIIIPVLTLLIFSQESNQMSESLGFEVNQTIKRIQIANQSKRIENLVQIYLQNECQTRD